MSAQVRIMPTEEADKGFALLRDIVEMTKNPKAIEQAYETRRKAAALTEEEVAKADSARAIISQAAALETEIAKQQDAIDLQKQEHIKNVASFEEKLKILDVRADQLAAISAGHEEAAKINDRERIRLQEIAQQLDADRGVANAQITAKQNTLSEREANANKEDVRLSEWEAKIKEKAQKLAAVATDW